MKRSNIAIIAGVAILSGLCSIGLADKLEQDHENHCGQIKILAYKVMEAQKMGMDMSNLLQLLHGEDTRRLIKEARNNKFMTMDEFADEMYEECRG